MKVGCPGCGQHYDVDANSIEHFFHCTECGIFFRGINAQPIIEKKFKHRKKSHPLQDVGNQLPDGTQEVKYSAENPPLELEDDEWEDDLEEAELNRPKPLSLPPWGIPAIIGGGLAVFLIMIIVMIVQSVQIHSINKQLVVTSSSLDFQKTELAFLQKKLEETETARAELEKQLEDFKTLPKDAFEKIGTEDLNAALLALDTRIADLSKAFGSSSPEVVAALDERIKTLEKECKNLDAQENLASGRFMELLKLVGNTKNRTTRSMLERIDYLEAAVSRDLNASGTPRLAPRIPIYLRLSALEMLVAGGSDAMQTAPNYPNGIVGQIEALKSQLNQLKWALGK